MADDGDVGIARAVRLALADDYARPAGDEEAGVARIMAAVRREAEAGQAIAAGSAGSPR